MPMVVSPQAVMKQSLRAPLLQTFGTFDASGVIHGDEAHDLCRQGSKLTLASGRKRHPLGKENASLEAQPREASPPWRKKLKCL